MKEKVDVLIYGYLKEKVQKGCNKKASCSSCGNCKGGCNKDESTYEKLYNELQTFINKSDIKDYVNMKFIDIYNKDSIGSEEVEDILWRGFEPPITVIDGIVRYYGGLSNRLIYNDIKELIK